MKSERVQKIIASSGFCSRRKAEELIKEGRVTINNKKASLGDKAVYMKDIIKVDNKIILKPEPAYLIAYKKPKLSLRQVINKKRWQTLKKRNIRKAIYEDKNIEGAILLTNDGELINYLSHPRYALKREYKIKLNKDRLAAWVKDFMKISEKQKCLFIDNIKIRSNIIEIIINGNHDRKLIELIKKIKPLPERIIRTAIGPIRLNDLKKGELRELKRKEVNILKKELNSTKLKT